MPTIRLDLSDLRAHAPRLFAGAVVRAVLLVATVLVMGTVMAHLSRALGWPPSMQSVATTSAGVVAVVPFVVDAGRKVARTFGDDDHNSPEAMPTGEVAAWATVSRVRHYRIQVAKAAVAAVFAGVAGLDFVLLVAHRAAALAAFREVFGPTALLNYRVILLALAAPGLLSLRSALRAWRGRKQDPRRLSSKRYGTGATTRDAYPERPRVDEGDARMKDLTKATIGVVVGGAAIANDTARVIVLGTMALAVSAVIALFLLVSAIERWENE